MRIHNGRRTTDNGRNEMLDQAAKLRQLSRTAAEVLRDPAAGVPMAVVVGARAGVGATTVAVNLAAALADRGERVLVVDAAEHCNNLAETAGAARGGKYTLADVLAAKCDLTDSVVDGAMGMRVVASRSRAALAGHVSRNAQHRLVSEIDSLRDEFDLVVVDAGHVLTASTRRLCMRGQLVALVTTTDDAAVLDAYAAMKRFSPDASRANVRLLINQAERDDIADGVGRRVDAACRQFLSLPLEALPSLPRGAYDFAAGGCTAPRVWESPNSDFGRAVLWLGRAVGNFLERQNCGRSERRDTETRAKQEFEPSIQHPASNFP
jgi:flagellar biosynthesis protein FlhG